jgi:predicted nucleic acid-binding protein
VILYVDTSALVPLLIDQSTSDACGELWDAADNVTATRLAYIEAAAALAMAKRMGRISTREARDGRSVLDDLWQVVDVIELDHELMSAAATLAVAHGLRGYDATHCAAALAVRDG